MPLPSAEQTEGSVKPTQGVVQWHLAGGDRIRKIRTLPEIVLPLGEPVLGREGEKCEGRGKGERKEGWERRGRMEGEEGRQRLGEERGGGGKKGKPEQRGKELKPSQ